MAGIHSSTLGVSVDHVAGLKAMLLSPLLICALLGAVRLARRVGSASARQWLERYDAAPLVTRAATWLLVVSAAIHLALAPAHRVEAPGTALLFLIDAIFLLAASAWVFCSRRRRLLAAALVVANIAAYLGYLIGRREDIDQLGVATKLIELAALGLILVPASSERSSLRSKLRWSGAAFGLIVSTMLTGVVLWGVTARPDTAAAQMDMAVDRGGGLTGMLMQRVPTSAPTTAQREAAAQLAAATKRGIVKYADVNAALADGYRPSTLDGGASVHYANAGYQNDGRLLDPTRPESLVYANTAHGPVLLGAMYEMPKPGEPGPDIGGSITQWHVHTGICVGPLPPLVVGFASPFGTCPSGSTSFVTPAMMHVWTVDIPGGPFSELPTDEVARVIRP